MKCDFVEIGTSNFDTLIEKSTDETIGLSIEPIKKYLEDLPDKNNVKKLNYAVSDEDGEGEMYYIPPEIIKKYFVPFHAYKYLQGCNALGHPHSSQVKALKTFGLSPELIEKYPIEVITFKTLVKRYNIESIAKLKIDAEGHDCTILRGYLDVCIENNKLFADTIIFEVNPLSDMKEVNQIFKSFSEHGYKNDKSWGNVVLKRKNW